MSAPQSGYDDQMPIRRPSNRFFVLNGLAGLVIGMAIVVTSAPFWTFYIAPLAMLPIWLAELRRLDNTSS